MLPFLAEPEASPNECKPDRSSIREPGGMLAPKARSSIKVSATPETELSPARLRMGCGPIRSRRPGAKRSIAPARKPPESFGSVNLISAPANIIALIETRTGAWSAPELADLLGCTGKHIYALAKSGRLPHLRIGSMIRFDPAATAEWLRDRFIAA